MMRSLFAGVSGLKTHQTRMDVIGHNIANVNTVAYKSSSMTFAALLSQTTQRASGPNATTGTGGVNARQIGLGVKTSAINVNITGQGASQSTGNPFDIMITGENFFIVNDGQSNYFTRDGSFYVDGAGNLAMTSLGYNVMGWQVDEETGMIRQDTVSALRIMSTANMNYPPEATTYGYMSGIIDKNDPDVTSSNGKVVSLKFFDALGYSYTAKFVFKQSDTEDGAKNIYSMELDQILDSNDEVMELTDTQKANIFGSTTEQKMAGKVTFLASDYQWNGTQLIKKADGKAVADLSQIVDTQANELHKGSYKAENVAEGGVQTTAQEQLDAIATAYGYGGATDEFLNLIYTEEVTQGTGDAATTVEVPWSIEQMLVALGGGTVTKPLNGNNYTAPKLNTFADQSATGDATAFETTGRYFNGVIVEYDKKNGTFSGIGGAETQKTVMLNLKENFGNGNFENIEIDMSATTNVNNKDTSTIGATNGKDDEYSTGSGRRNGAMNGISIQQNGMIYASYDNGMTKLLGQIATAKFANASGLEKLADNLYAETLNSGTFDGVGVDITAEGDYMSTGQLEMSNVDLSSEFTEMITTQRGFQANSRIITVSDTMLEELTNLKR